MFLPHGDGSSAGCGAAALLPVPGCPAAPDAPEASRAWGHGGSAEATVTPVAPSWGCLAVAEAVRGPALLRLSSSHEQREAWQAMAGPRRVDEGDVGSPPCPRDSMRWAGFGVQ